MDLIYCIDNYTILRMIQDQLKNEKHNPLHRSVAFVSALFQYTNVLLVLFRIEKKMLRGL